MSGRDGERGRDGGMTARNAKTAAVKRLSSTVCETVEMFPQWTLLSQEHIAMLLELSVDQVQLQFEDALGLKKQQTCLKEAALLDYFVAGFWWAKEVNFTCQQISFFMALLQLVLDNMKEQQMPFAENFKAFTQNLLATRKSSSVDTDVNPLFDLDQIKSITDYFKSSLFQHYRLYQFLFTQPREEMLLGMERSIEVANSADFAAPLEEGMSTELYFRYMAPAPDASPPQSIQGLDECLEKNEEEPDERQQGEAHESPGSFSVEDVREVLVEMTKEMLAKLQADFTDRLRIQEESYISRLDSLKRVASK